LGSKKPEFIEAAWIRNTLSLSEFWVSEQVIKNVKDRCPALEIVSGTHPVKFDKNGNLIKPCL